MAAGERLHCTVVYALADCQAVVSMDLEPGASVQAAIERSGLLERFPELRSRALQAGVFHRRTSLEAPVRDGDRIEIYRPLQIDPKEARRLRVASKRARRHGPVGTRS